MFNQFLIWFQEHLFRFQGFWLLSRELRQPAECGAPERLLPREVPQRRMTRA